MNLDAITFSTFAIMNNENFPRQLSKVKVTVNSNLNSIGLIQQIQLESKYNTSYAMARSTKHGPVSLVLCLKSFRVELSICVDLSINPGPYGDTS